MADIYDHGGGDGELVITTASVSGNYVLGEGAPGIPSTLIVQLVIASGTISIVPKVRSSQKNARRNTDNIAFQPIPYTRRNLGGTVSDDTVVSAALTAGAVFKMDISGMQASLEITQTSGVGVVYWSIVDGRA